MPAHVIYPKVDRRPAGFSSKWLKDVLRTRLAFDGAIFSDDLSMEAGRYIDGELLSFTDAVLAALGAGCDLAMVCNQSIGNGAPLDELLEGLGAAAAAGHWQGQVASEARRQMLLPDALASNWPTTTGSAAYRGAQQLLSQAVHQATPRT